MSEDYIGGFNEARPAENTGNAKKVSKTNSGYELFSCFAGDFEEKATKCIRVKVDEATYEAAVTGAEAEGLTIAAYTGHILEDAIEHSYRPFGKKKFDSSKYKIPWNPLEKELGIGLKDSAYSSGKGLAKDNGIAFSDYVRIVLSETLVAGKKL